MARRAKSDDGTEPKGSNGTLFINYDLTDDMRKAFKVWRDKNSDAISDLLDKAIEAGYQVSIKRDAYNECIGAFLIAKDTKTQNDGYILTGRSSSVFGALCGVLYRHYVLFECLWPVHNHRSNPLDDD